MTFQKGVKFRIYPNREQQNLIDRTLGCSRLIYNKGLAMREDAAKALTAQSSVCLPAGLRLTFL